MTLLDLHRVIETFSDENLRFSFNGSRSIAEILQHIQCSQNCMYVDDIVLGKKNHCTWNITLVNISVPFNKNVNRKCVHLNAGRSCLTC